MKIGLCVFSGYKIYPGHGKSLVKADGKVNAFLNSKCERSFLLKRNPRKIRWTVLYRRKHKKGQEEEIAKRRTRKTQKFQRAIVGASLAAIMAKRNEAPELRKARRDKAIAAAKAAAHKKAEAKAAEVKEKEKAKKAAAKETKKAAPKAKTAPKQKAPKNIQKSAPRVGGKR